MAKPNIDSGHLEEKYHNKYTFQLRATWLNYSENLHTRVLLATPSSNDDRFLVTSACGQRTLKSVDHFDFNRLYTKSFGLAAEKKVAR